MQRYFISFNSDDEIVSIVGDDFHHIKNVMRMKVGDEFYVSNGTMVYYAAIKTINIDSILIQLLYEVKQNSELSIEVTLAQGMPKGDKFETVIQKSTELGAFELIPVISERSLVKVDSKTEMKKLDRFKKIAKEAAEQSHRVKIPNINHFMSLKELIVYSQSFDYKLVAYEASTKEEHFNLEKCLNKIKSNEKMLVFIGPEGGISEKELQLLKDNDFQVISLGNRILRTETAPLFVMSAIAYELELKG